MTDDVRLAEILRLLDPPSGFRPWHGGASVLGCLRGVPPELARWKPAPDRHSIWELTLHLAYWKYAVRRRLEGSETGAFPRSPSDWPAVPERAGDSAWNADRTLLREEHGRLVEVARGLPPRRLDSEVGRGTYRVADLLLGVVQHDAHHVGQIQLLKRMGA